MGGMVARREVEEERRLTFSLLVLLRLSVLRS
jgi:hypothetical protein